MEFYNLNADPYEQHNLAYSSTMAGILRDMQQELKRKVIESFGLAGERVCLTANNDQLICSAESLMPTVFPLQRGRSVMWFTIDWPLTSLSEVTETLYAFERRSLIARDHAGI